jgi:hypothetical protein
MLSPGGQASFDAPSEEKPDGDDSSCRVTPPAEGEMFSLRARQKLVSSEDSYRQACADQDR